MKNAQQLREIAELNNNVIERTITDIGIKCEQQAKFGNYNCYYSFNQEQLIKFKDKTLIDDLITILKNDYQLKVNIIREIETIFYLEISW